MDKVPRLPRKNDMSTSSDTSRKTRFCGFPQGPANLILTTITHTHTFLLKHIECHKVPRLPQNDMSTSSDTSRKTRFCGFPQRHANFTLTTVARTHIPPLKHIERHKVPRLPRKTTWAHLLTRREKHICVASPKDTPTLPSRRSCAHTFLRWNTLNVTKCHAYYAKRHEHIFWHVEKDTFLWLPPKTRQLYPHDGRARTVANGCKLLQTVADTKSRVTRTRVNPQTPNVKQEPFATHSGKTNKKIFRDSWLDPPIPKTSGRLFFFEVVFYVLVFWIELEKIFPKKYPNSVWVLYFGRTYTMLFFIAFYHVFCMFAFSKQDLLSLMMSWTYTKVGPRGAADYVCINIYIYRERERER